MTTAALTIAFDARLGKLEAALKNVNKDLNQLGNSAKNAGNGFNQLSRDSTVAEAAVYSYQQSVEKLSRSFQQLQKAFIVFQLIQAAVNTFTSLSDRVNDVADDAAKLGIAGEYVQALGIAFEEAGSNADKGIEAFGRFNQQLAKASAGNKQSVASFKAIGVSITESTGAVRDNVAVFDDVAKAIHQATTEQQKLLIATRFFGQKGAREAVAAIGEMQGSLVKSREEMQKLGLIIDDVTANKLDKIGTSLDNIWRRASVVFANIAAALQPAFSVIEKVMDFVIEDIRKSLPQIGGFITEVVNLITSVVSFSYNRILTLLRNITNVVEEGVRSLGEVLSRAADFTYGTPLESIAGLGTMLSRDALSTFEAAGSLSKFKEKLDDLKIDEKFENFDLREYFAEGAEATDTARKSLSDFTTELEDLEKTGQKTKKIDPFEKLYSFTKKAREEIAKVSKAYKEAFENIYKETRTPIEQFTAEAERVTKVFSRVGQSDRDKFGGLDTLKRSLIDLVKDTGSEIDQNIGSWNEFGNTVEKVIDQLRAQGFDNAADNVQGTLIKMRKEFDNSKSEIDETVASFDEVSGELTNWASGLEDTFVGLVDGTIDTKDAFTEMTDSILESINRLVFRQFALKPLERAISLFFDNITNAMLTSQGGGGQPGGNFWSILFGGAPARAARGFSPAFGLPQGIINSPHLFKFASGGAFTRWGVAGEAGPEAVLPLTRNSQGKLGVEAMNVGTTVNVYNNAPNTTSRTQERSSPLGGKEIDVYIEQVVEKGIQGGRFNKSMTGAFGVSQRGRP